MSTGRSRRRGAREAPPENSARERRSQSRTSPPMGGQSMAHAFVREPGATDPEHYARRVNQLAAIYLGMFALGTWLGMTALTAVLAWPVGLALRLRRAHQLLASGSGLAAIAFGLYYAWAI